jgi:hypothetical protein
MRHLTVFSRRAFERRLILAATAQGMSDVLQQQRARETVLERNRSARQHGTGARGRRDAGTVRCDMQRDVCKGEAWK